MIVKPIKTRIFTEGESLADFIFKHIPRLRERALLVVTSKIVALAEGRTAPLSEKTSLIKSESEVAIKTKHTWLTITDGALVASAGIDESNADGKLILLPKDSFASAKKLRDKLRTLYKIKHLGVLIVDSRTLPLRAGAVGMAMGYAGFRGIRDYRGTRDLFGRVFKISRTNIADGLAAAAVLAMGEGTERYPLAVVEGCDVEFAEKVSRREIKIDIRDDMFAPLIRKLRNRG